MEELRETIRKILEQNNSVSEEIVTEQENSMGNMDWIRFEMFGWEVLKEINYQGDKHKVLNKVKKMLEEDDGWEFYDNSEGLD